MSWFTNPYRFGVSFPTSEWIITRTGNDFKYSSFNLLTPSHTLLSTFAMPNPSSGGVASDGTFVFASGGGGTQLAQIAWNGSALTSRHNANVPAPASNALNREMYIMPGNANRIMYLGAQDFAVGLLMCSYQSAPAYSYANNGSYSPTNRNYFKFLDFRLGTQSGLPGYGNTVVACGGNTSQDLIATTASGSTITAYTGLSAVVPSRFGQDRDSGRFAGVTGANTTVYIYQLNLTTRVITAIGTGTATGTVQSLTWCNDKLITMEAGGNLRVYTVSGSTLTLQSTIALGGTAEGILVTSPHTNAVYLMAGSSANRRIRAYTLSGNTLTYKAETSYNYENANASRCIWFLSAALPTV